MSINTIGSDMPIEVSFGGTGNSTLTNKGVLYGNTTAPIGITSAGSATEILTSQGAALPPLFAPATGLGDGLEFLTTFAAPFTNGTNVEITTGYSANYNTYLFVTHIDTIGSSGSSPVLGVQLSTDNGASWITTTTFYNTRMVFMSRTGTNWLSQSATGTGAAGTGLPIFGTIKQEDGKYNSSIWISGISKLAMPTALGYISRRSTSASGAGYGYVAASYEGPAITANRMRVVNAGYTSLVGTVSVWRVKTS